MATLAELCPEVPAGIAASALGPFLTPEWSDWAPPVKLERLRALLAHPEPDGSARRPDPAAVPAIVEQTKAAAEAPSPSLWSRFKDWLRSLLGEQSRDDGSGWLAKWLNDHMPAEKTVVAILYVILAALVAGIGWIVYTELQAAGAFRRRTGKRGSRAAAPAAAPPEASLDGASEAEAPSILVTLLVGELRRLGRVQDRLSMTHRELGRAARFDAAADGEAFEGVLGAAERLRYAGAPPAPDLLRRALDAGRGLLERLVRQPRDAA